MSNNSSSKAPQSGLRKIEREISMTSGASEPKSSQEIYWPLTPPPTGNPRTIDSLKGRIGAPLVDSKSLNKRIRSDAPELPVAKKSRQLPKGYTDEEISAESARSTSRFFSSSNNNTAKVNARNPQPFIPVKVATAKGSLARPFLSPEQKRILSLAVDDGISLFYTGSAG
jgi:hypothetical protein